MSLAIDVDKVKAVLLADGWHEVQNDSFALDSYEYLWSGRHGWTVADAYEHDREPMIMHGGGASDVCATGFTFQNGADRLGGPLTAILAVRYRA